MDISIILVEPEDCRNIGAAARAIKTMGHSRMILVNPAGDHLSGKAKALAHGSVDILQSATVFDSLEAATVDIDFLIATTARHRRSKFRYVNCQDIPEIIRQKKGLIQSLGVVFGGERSGLRTEHLCLCDTITSISTADTYPSLNLAQSVMVYSFLLSQLEAPTTIDRRVNPRPVYESEYSFLKTAAMELMDDLEIRDDRILRRNLLHGIARLDHDDLYLVQNIRRKISEKIGSLKDKIEQRER